MARINLTFDALPTFVSTPTFFSPDEDVDRRLRTLEGVYARCNAALRFNSWIDAGKDLIHLRDDERAPMSVAFLRAALMEFAGMEEALATDLHRDAVPLRIRDTRNAMLVVLRELRNVQVHLVRTSLVTGTRPAVHYYQGEEYRHDTI